MTGSWRLDALCAGCDPELWFPERGESPREAVAICEECPVRRECLEAALVEERGLVDVHGVRGGLTVEARKRLVRGRRRVA